MGSPTAVEHSSTTMTLVEYDLVDAPDIPRKYSPRQVLRPTTMQATYRDGELRAINLVGRLVRADGSLGVGGFNDRYYPGEEPERLAWAWALVPTNLSGGEDA